jgi:hypothetical protein
MILPLIDVENACKHFGKLKCNVIRIRRFHANDVVDDNPGSVVHTYLTLIASIIEKNREE